MILTDYCHLDSSTVTFTPEKASAFAKGVAGDFNPIHDPDNKRFCVPGDLLFAVLLHRYGVGSTTSVQFTGMIDGQSPVHLPGELESAGQTIITDGNAKAVLSLFFKGDRVVNPVIVHDLVEQYIKFSGKTFPDILVPLLREASSMINPERPMVIYKDMSIELHDGVVETVDNIDGKPPGSDAAASSDTSEENNAQHTSHIELRPAENSISVNGRKGAVQLNFTIYLNGEHIGAGQKNMVLAGLREYDEAAMQSVVARYTQWKEAYQQHRS